MKTKSNKMFVSAFQSGFTGDANWINHNKAREMLKREGVVFGEVKGCYKGKLEYAFILVSDSQQGHKDNFQLAYSLGQLFNQESILEVHNDDTAVLHYLGGDSVKLGQLVEVPSAEALASDSYTFEPVTGRYFVVK